MKHTLKRENVIGICKRFFKRKSSLYSLEIVFLYGSWCGGYPRQDSDIDIAVLFAEECGEDVIFRYITDMSVLLSGYTALEVNIIHLRWDFDKPMLYYNAIVLGEPLFIKDYNKYITLKNEAIYQMEDFSLFGIGWQMEVVRTNLKAIRYAKI